MKRILIALLIAGFINAEIVLAKTANFPPWLQKPPLYIEKGENKIILKKSDYPEVRMMETSLTWVLELDRSV